MISIYPLIAYHNIHTLSRSFPLFLHFGNYSLTKINIEIQKRKNNLKMYANFLKKLDIYTKK